MEPTEVDRDIAAPPPFTSLCPACACNLPKLGLGIQRILHLRRKRGRDAPCRRVNRQGAVLIDLLKQHLDAAGFGYDFGIPRNFRFVELNLLVPNRRSKAPFKSFTRTFPTSLFMRTS